MSEMIERVANAIGDAIEEAHISHLRLAARAAIRAMREPTEAMLAGIDIGENNWQLPSYWRAMIDEALK